MVRPINYDLEFEPHFSNFTFHGKEIIDILISAKTNTIQLDTAELKIKHCHLESNGRTIKATTKLDEKKEELTIKLAKKISGKAKL